MDGVGAYSFGFRLERILHHNCVRLKCENTFVVVQAPAEVQLHATTSWKKAFFRGMGGIHHLQGAEPTVGVDLLMIQKAEKRQDVHPYSAMSLSRSLSILANAEVLD